MSPQVSLREKSTTAKYSGPSFHRYCVCELASLRKVIRSPPVSTQSAFTVILGHVQGQKV